MIEAWLAGRGCDVSTLVIRIAERTVTCRSNLLSEPHAAWHGSSRTDASSLYVPLQPLEHISGAYERGFAAQGIK
jgi:hypothetical protein